MSVTAANLSNGNLHESKVDVMFNLSYILYKQ